MVLGTYYFGRKRVACRNAWCTTCRAPQFAEGRRSLVVFHFCYVPILPIATTVRWFCYACEEEIDARRPSRPLILIAGVFFGLLVTAVGVKTLIDGHERETALGCLIFGPSLVVGLAYMVIRRDFRAYITSRQAVAPLPGDHCPYCRAPLFPTGKPRCHACRVDIITK